MKLSEVFAHLAYGELSQVVLGEINDGELKEKQYPALISHINLGLTALYKRFYLKEETFEFALSQAGNLYTLQLPDLIKIDRVLTSADFKVGLNDGRDPYSCFTPSSQSIRVPAAIINKDPALPPELYTDTLKVVYQANHPTIDGAAQIIDPTKIEVELPNVYLQALLYFVASRVHNPIGMVNEFHSGNTWFSKYERECQRLETENLDIEESTENNRLREKGWV